jgi:hypothetical protein
VAQFDQVTAPEYLDGLEAWPLGDVRARRDEVTEVETGLSYMRRMVQGRLDILLAEQQRRRLGGDAEDVADLVARLPRILGDHVHVPGLGRLPTLMAPGDIDRAADDAALEAILPSAQLASLAELPDSELARASHGLDDLERTISSQRREVFDVLDRLQREIVRRYRTGEASVDNLLS